ncbi:MAG: P-loop NTPase [Actinomycetia bacterium]|nr:P-loop NTPase [Actinomycetes bacterium]
MTPSEGLRVATALADAAAESAVVQAVNKSPARATIVRRCRDIVELRAVAATGQIDLAVVDGDLRGLDRDVVTTLAATSVRLIVVTDEDGDALRAMGASTVVDRTLVGLDAALSGDAAGAVVEPAAQVTGSRDEAGRVVAVWGPTGAPGRTTVAVELATALTRRGLDTLLIDADTVGPSIAQHLGLIDDTSGLAAAVRTAARGLLDPVGLAGFAVSVPRGPRVLVGLPSADRWTELRLASVDALLRCARDTVPWTVVDVGFGVEGSGLDWADPGAPVRYGAARATLSAADVVVCVGRSDPIGLTRFIRGIPAVRDLAPTAQLMVVVNQIASGAEGRRVRALLAEELADPVAAELPADAAGVRGAMARATSVSEHSPRSPFVASIDNVAAQVLASDGSYDQSRDRATWTHRRLLRGTHRRHRHSDARVV